MHVSVICCWHPRSLLGQTISDNACEAEPPNVAVYTTVLNACGKGYPSRLDDGWQWLVSCGWLMILELQEQPTVVLAADLPVFCSQGRARMANSIANAERRKQMTITRLFHSFGPRLIYRIFV